MSTLGPDQSVKLTKSTVDKAVIPATGQAFTRDRELKGFALRVTAGGVKSYIVEKRVDGRVRRITLGRHGELTCEQARKQALKLLGQLAIGIDVIGERERDRLAAVTLGEAFTDFSRDRKHLKPKTLYDYGRFVEKAFGDWRSTPLPRLTATQIVERHRKLGEVHGGYYANGAMRFLSSLFNYAIAQYVDQRGEPVLPANPVERISKLRAWYPVERRRTVIRIAQLPSWYAAVEALRRDPLPGAETVADFLLFLLFTGLRRSEGQLLTWDRVDLDERSVFIPEPKNREPHHIPIAPYIADLLGRRQTYARNAYVFPGDGRRGYLVEPKRQIAKVVELSGVTFTPHDLRRTFATIAEGLDIAPYALKRLLNHKMANDVTAGYIVTDLERLRAPVEKVAAYLLRAMGVQGSAPVISIRGNIDGN